MIIKWLGAGSASLFASSWIEQAVSVGGKLKCRQVGDIFVSEISWPEEPQVILGTGATLTESLQRLDGNLMEDVADEMVKAGVVVVWEASRTMATGMRITIRMINEDHRAVNN